VKYSEISLSYSLHKVAVDKFPSAVPDSGTVFGINTVDH